ncbi:androgen-induced gene 1 protein isoform X5 [Loxodonta africana]|uniref:androgen-induced gene 1 protein isoform X7 n=1 Tax=Elephas maximus indicus TaxID=99487 RepID=UPI0021168E9E|nr:androgen-induced gene 1 protein isoform X7 [Elephas maximus indicus]
MALVPCQVLRVAILLSYCSILCNYKAIEMPSHQTYGGSWKFLTFIDLANFGELLTRRGASWNGRGKEDHV